MGDHRADDLFKHVDLNQEPLVGPSSPSLPTASPPGFGFVSGKHVTPRRAIEDRFRVLEAVSASARKPKSDVGLLCNGVGLTSEQLKGWRGDHEGLSSEAASSFDFRR
ncbi:hypothetical protein E3N88_13963 [Mikania micrantha]|uniref:Uncharacterized protein n=1 Tax=Mikania micrantha TaxID=192012 RepID=A0A5N6P251_9ASTR|nr:hypothetical protein E3N88_13963 [Mikania micrantha]